MNPKNKIGKNFVHLDSDFQRNKIIKMSLQKDKALGDSNKTFNQNISTYNMKNRYISNNINKYQHSITLSQNN
jgi:hypothetical protein